MNFYLADNDNNTVRHIFKAIDEDRTSEGVGYATPEWVDRYNHRRLLAPIGDVPPAEVEARHHAHVDDQALAA